MAARRRTRGGSKKPPEKRLSTTFWPRDANGRFIALADYRPRGRDGRFLPTKKIPKKVRELVERAREERRAKEREAAERAARVRAERARNAALAGAAKRRRIAREESERRALEERHAEAARAAREAEAAERRRIAEAEELRVAEKKRLEAERKERAKQKRKERRERENAEIERLRKQQKEIEEADKKRLAEEREDERKRREQAVLDAEARAEEERSRRALEEMQRAEEERGEVLPSRPRTPPPPTPEEPAPVPPPPMEGVVVTPEEIIEMAMLEMRKLAIEQGKIDRVQSDPTLVRNPRTHSLGQTIRVETMIGEPGIAQDLGEIAADVAEQIMGIDRGAKVYVSILLTEWGPADGFVGSIDKVIAWGKEGTLVQAWQATYGMSTPEAVRRAVVSVMQQRMRQNPRAASLIEGIVIRGVKPAS